LKLNYRQQNASGIGLYASWTLNPRFLKTDSTPTKRLWIGIALVRLLTQGLRLHLHSAEAKPHKIIGSMLRFSASFRTFFKFETIYNSLPSHTQYLLQKISNANDIYPEVWRKRCDGLMEDAEMLFISCPENVKFSCNVQARFVRWFFAYSRWQLRHYWITLTVGIQQRDLNNVEYKKRIFFAGMRPTLWIQTRKCALRYRLWENSASYGRRATLQRSRQKSAAIIHKTSERSREQHVDAWKKSHF